MAFHCKSRISFCNDPFIGKNAWPELCGTEGNMAIATIERENPNVYALILLERTIVTSEIRCVSVNENGVFTKVPVIG